MIVQIKTIRINNLAIKGNWEVKHPTYNIYNLYSYATHIIAN